MIGDPTFAEIAAYVAALPPEELEEARWYGGKGRPIARVALAEAFDLGGGGLLAAVDVFEQGSDEPVRYVLPLARAEGGRPVIDDEAPLRALAVAIAEGRTIPSLPRRPAPVTTQPAPVTAALVCRPAAALRDLVPGGVAAVAALDARPLGRDQTNTSVVLGDRLVLKAYRRLEDGLNPDLEVNAYLAEEVEFGAVPRLAGFAELVSAAGAATVALLAEFVADAADEYETLAEELTAWILAPGEVTVEFAAEEAAALGRLTAALHAALALGADVPGFEPREATRDELRSWRRAGDLQLQQAIDLVHGAEGDELRTMAPTIAEQLTVLEALPTVPLVTRVHGDLHLGQVLRTADGYRIIDFEGEPNRPLADRRRHDSPLRDAASMLRSLDHVGRSARRRAERLRGGPVEDPGLDVDAWLVRARERFVEDYRRTLRELGAPIDVDEDLLRAFEFEKESYEFVYAATFLPEWLWAPLEGMRGLVADASVG